jgi:transcriptional regulator with XRE-family HTH domain
MRLTTIKLRRLEKGILQVQLAASANMPRARLSEIENGHLAPKGDELTRIALALAIPVEKLLER